MSTSQHTTDPWVNRDSKIETMPDRNGAVLVIAEVYRSNINHEANAQLIAAAPDLLTLAERFLHEIEQDNFALDLRFAIRAAIAKATGKGGGK